MEQVVGADFPVLELHSEHQLANLEVALFLGLQTVSQNPKPLFPKRGVAPGRKVWGVCASFVFL